MVVVGVDLGSSSARAISIDPDGKVLGVSRTAYAGAERWSPGRAEPGAWLAAVIECVETLGREVPAARHPEAFAVGGQNPTTVPIGGGLAVTVRHPAGSDAGDPVAQHLAQLELLRGEHPGCEAAEVWDWLLLQFGAPRVQGHWPGDRELPDFGAPMLTGQVVGEASGAGALAAGTPLVAGAADAYLACWAAGIDRPRRAIDPGGRTGGYAVGAPAGVSAPGMWSFTSAARAVDVIGGPVSSHGLMVEWVTRVVGRPVDDALALAADAPAGSRGVIVLPYLEGERAPRWNSSLRAHVAGLGSDTGAAELVRAVLEGCAFGLRHVKGVLDAAGVPSDVMVCCGSAARSALWNQIKASVLEVPLEVPEVADLAAYGAALAAGAGAGWWPAPGTAPSGSWPRPAMTTVEPVANPVYTEAYPRFIALGDSVEALTTTRPLQGAHPS